MSDDLSELAIWKRNNSGRRTVSEQPNEHVFIPPQPTESERLAWHVANSTTQHAKHLQEALTAAQQEVTELNTALRESNAATQRWMEAAGKLDGDNARLREQLAELEKTQERLVAFSADNSRELQQRVDRLRELLRELAFELKDIAPCHSGRIEAELAKGE